MRTGKNFSNQKEEKRQLKWIASSTATGFFSISLFLFRFLLSDFSNVPTGWQVHQRGRNVRFFHLYFLDLKKTKSFFLFIWANLLQGIIRNAVNGVVCFAVKGGRETPSPGWPALQHMAPKLPLSRPPSLFFTHTPVAAAAAAEETFKTVRYVSLKMAVIKATAADCTLLCHSKENWEKKMTTAAGGEMPSRWAASGHTKATPWQQPVERFRLALGSQSIPT